MEPKVLLVEDMDQHQAKWCASLAVHGPVSAHDARAGIRLFNEHRSSLKVIVLDGALANNTLGIQVLLQVQKSGFTGALIAASGEESLQRDLQREGCTYAANEKDAVPAVVEEALKDIATLDSLGTEKVQAMRAYFLKKVAHAPRFGEFMVPQLEKAMRKGILTPQSILVFDRVVPNVDEVVGDRALRRKVYDETGKESVLDLIEFLIRTAERTG